MMMMMMTARRRRSSSSSSSCVDVAVMMMVTMAVLALVCVEGVQSQTDSSSTAAVPSEAACNSNPKLYTDTLQKFLVTLVTRTCNLRIGYDHSCDTGCQVAIMDIGNTAQGCLRYDSFGDTVFDMMRETATNAGFGGEVPPREVMNMTELNDWAEEFCSTALFTGAPAEPDCRTDEPQVYTARSGVIAMPPAALNDGGSGGEGSYKNYLRCLFSIEPEGGIASNEHIRVRVESLDMDTGDLLTFFSGAETSTFPIITLTGRQRPLSAIYSPDDAQSLLIGFASDASNNNGAGFSVTYEVSDEDLDALQGCNDPFATNFDAEAFIPKTTACAYEHQDGSLIFQGTAGHVEVPSLDVVDHLPSRDITIAAWVKVNELTESRYATYIGHMMDDFLVEKGFSLGLINIPVNPTGDSGIVSHSCAVFTAVHEGFQSGPYGMVFEELEDTDGASNINFGEWQHVACTYDGLTIKLYVDGMLVATDDRQIGDIVYPDADYTPKQSNSLFTIGAYHDNDDYYSVHGELDELMIFNEALPEDAIIEASAGRASTESVAADYSDGLMHWYRLNENDGAQVFDEVERELPGFIVDVLGDQVYRAESGVPP